MKKETKELVKAILEWWKEHQYDVTGGRDDERNLYDEEPEFVRLVKEMC